MRTDQLIRNLDLTSVINRIKTDFGWSEDHLERAAHRYKTFLSTAGTSPDGPAESDIDQFWHYHLLDTRKYQQDCKALFNGYLHHVPASDGTSKCSKVLEQLA